MKKISRRQLVAGAAAASAAGTAARMLGGCSTDNSSSSPSTVAPEMVRLDFDLPPAFAASPEFKVQVNVGAAIYDLSPHTASSRAEARAENPFLRSVPDDELTDYAEIGFTADAPQLFTVTYDWSDDPTDNRQGLLLAGIQIPSVGLQEARRIKGNRFSLHPQRVARAMPYVLPGETVGDEVANFVSWENSAMTFISQHPELLSLDATTLALVMSIIASLPETAAVAKVMKSYGQLLGPESRKQGWAESVFSLDFEKQKIPRLGVNGKPIMNPAGTSVEYEYDFIPATKVLSAAGTAIRRALQLVRDDSDLEELKYYVAPGFHAIVNGEGPPDVGITGDPDSPSDDGGEGDAGDDDDAGGEGGTLPVAVGTLFHRRPIADATAASVKFEREGEWRYGQRVKIQSIFERTLVVRVDNIYFRYLGVWLAFKDGAGKVLKLSDAGLGKGGLDTDWCQYQSMIDPPPRLMGIPLNVDTYQTVTVTLPNQAASVVVLTGAPAPASGDQIPEYNDVEVPGLAMTLTFCYGVPVMFMAVGAGGLIVNNAKKELAQQFGEAAIKAAFQYGMKTAYSSGGASQFASLGSQFLNLVIKKAIGSAAVFVASRLSAAAAESAAKAAAPIVGWIALAIDTAVSLAEMITTTVQICTSVKCAASSATFTHSIQIQVLPDPEHPGAFPATATRVAVLATCATQTPLRLDLDFDPTTAPGSLSYRFDGVPSGGDVTLTVVFISANGFLAGQASVKIANRPAAGQDTLFATLTTKEELVPLLASTQYSHKARLTVAANAHVWTSTPIAPTAARGDLDCRLSSGGLCTPGQITVSTAASQVAWSYQSSSAAYGVCGPLVNPGQQVYMVETVSTNSGPDSALSTTPCGYRQPVLVAYDLRGGVNGNHFAAIPLSSGGYVVRRLALGSRNALTAIEQQPAVGTFASTSITSFRYHTKGYLVGLNSAEDKVEVLPVGTASYVDYKQSPQASILCGRGSAPGLISGSIAVSPAYTGQAFLVLERGNRRLQALDDNGNPVENYFAGTGWTAPLVSGNVTYLDLCVESTGFIYVLSYANEGTSANDFLLDIYQPTGPWLTQTRGLVAARLAVDLWRNVYTLNFEKIVLAGRTEASISQWIPSTPPGPGVP